MAAACPFANSITATSTFEMAAAVDLVRACVGPTMAVFKITADVPPQVVPPRDGPLLVRRFRAALPPRA